MNFEGLTLTELKDMAKEKGVKNISKLKKEDLIQILSKETNTIPTEEIKKEEKNSSVTSGGYKLTNEGDEFVEGILEVLPDGYGFEQNECDGFVDVWFDLKNRRRNGKAELC